MDKKKLKNIAKIIGVLAFGAILYNTFFPSERKTNYVYLQGLITENTFEKTAVKLVDKFKSQESGLDERRLIEMKAIISNCLKLQAQSYLNSGDPYLQALANKETPAILASRFMNACNLTQK
jgi:hypothetical protein